MGATPWLITDAVCPSPSLGRPGRGVPGWSDRRHALMLGLILLLNVGDGLLTLHIVMAGLGWEENPFLRGLLVQGPGYFFGTKLFLCGISTGLLWRTRHHFFSQVTVAAGALIYATVVAYELVNLYW